MTRRRIVAVAAFIGVASVVGGNPRPTFGDWALLTLGSPFQSSSDGFFENVGVNFGFNIPGGSASGGGSSVVGLSPQGMFNPGGINFGQGGAGAALPPFGGFTPGSGSSFGFTINTGRGSASFSITADQGSSRSLVSQSGSLTLMNGGTGSISATSLRPFVTSVTPVVGGFAGAAQPQFTMPGFAPPVSDFGTSALGERLQRLGDSTGPRSGSGGAGGVDLGAPAVRDDAKPAAAADPVSRDLVAARDSTAGRPAAGIAEIRAQQAAEDQAADVELRQILAHAEEAMAAGKPNVARIYYQQLARRATGSLKQQALDGLKAKASQSTKETSHSHGSTGP
jgi:hypothetical protein